MEHISIFKDMVTFIFNIVYFNVFYIKCCLF